MRPTEPATGDPDAGDRRRRRGGVLTWVDSLSAVARQQAHAHAASPAIAAQDWTPRVLTARQNDAVIALTELIIPDTGPAPGTPGAKAALVNRFVDTVLHGAPPADREKFIKGLAWIDARSTEALRQGLPRRESPPTRRHSSRGCRRTATPTARIQHGTDFFQAIKVLTINGYYTSEIGLRQELGDDGQLFMLQFPGCTHRSTSDEDASARPRGCCLASPAVQQPPATPYAPKQSDRPEAVNGDEPGFQPIFDGKTLSGWEGDPTYWRVENGSLVGEITPATVIKSNTFIIWRGGRPKDFELKLDYRITPEGNSGINYRSAVVPDPVTPANKFAMRGLSVRSRRPEAISRQQLRGEGPAVSRRARTADSRRRRTAAGAGRRRLAIRTSSRRR